MSDTGRDYIIFFESIARNIGNYIQFLRLLSSFARTLLKLTPIEMVRAHLNL